MRIYSQDIVHLMQKMSPLMAQVVRLGIRSLLLQKYISLLEYTTKFVKIKDIEPVNEIC